MALVRLLLVLGVCTAVVVQPADDNLRPIIGVLSLPNPYNRAQNYIPSNYVRFVES
jgi:hypothetical protein